MPSSFLSRRFFVSFVAALSALATPAATWGADPVPTTVTVQTLYSFLGNNNGYNPRGGLLLTNSGNLYGTTSAGGAAGLTGGTIFRLTPGGTLSTLSSFASAASAAPLVQGVDNNFYGVNANGGMFAGGLVYRLTPDGTLMAIGAFSGAGTGSSPSAALCQGADLNFYGAAATGGTFGEGTIYRLSAQGGLTALHSFNAAKGEGVLPYGALVQGRDGDFYGTASAGGAHAGGTVFKISTLGFYSEVYAFTGGADGSHPHTGLTLGADGNFYGTTYDGGLGNGTVFRLTPQGTLTTLYAFDASSVKGGNPATPLVAGGDGSFYGTTVNGGTASRGTIFAVTPTGTFTSIHSFNGLDGSGPSGALATAGDGIFYGTTVGGGPTGQARGTVYRLNLRTLPDAPGALGFSVGSTSVSESGGSATLVVARTGGATGGVSVRYTTVDGSARAGVDYLAISGILSWPTGDTRARSISVPISDLGLSDHSTRGFTVKLSDPTHGATLGDIPTAGVAIQEDDAPSPPRLPAVSLTVLSDGTATVGGRNARVLFSRDGDLAAPLTVTYQVKGSARNGVDYRILSGTLTFPAGAASVKLKIKPLPTAPHKGTLTIKLLPLAPLDGSFQIDTPKVKVLFVNP